MIRKVSKVLCALMILGAVMVMAPAKARAAFDLGQFCWRLSPFVDVIRISWEQMAPNSQGLYALTMRWRASTAYQVLGSGAGSFDPSNGNSFAIGLTGAQNKNTAFNGNKTVSLFALLNPITLSGSWLLQAPSASGAVFNNSGTLTFLPSCPVGSDADTGVAAGD